MAGDIRLGANDLESAGRYGRLPVSRGGLRSINPRGNHSLFVHSERHSVLLLLMFPRALLRAPPAHVQQPAPTSVGVSAAGPTSFRRVRTCCKAIAAALALASRSGLRTYTGSTRLLAWRLRVQGLPVDMYHRLTYASVKQHTLHHGVLPAGTQRDEGRRDKQKQGSSL